MISIRTIDNIRSAMQIEDVVSEYVNLKKRGSTLLGLCPFHNERTPSFTVSPTRDIFKCFGCGRGGDAITFVMEHQALSYPEALRYLANKYHIEIQETQASATSIAERDAKDALYIVLEGASKYYQDQLLNSEEGQTEGLSYCRQRGLNDNAIKTFSIGWAPKGYDNFSKWALKEGYSREGLISTGLSIARDGEEDGSLVDRFTERLMFPIHNVMGRVAGFGGRTLKTDVKLAKYINSPETEVYQKSNLLYGLFQSKKAIRNADRVILVEGYTDVISMHTRGLEEVVASSGTSLTEGQLGAVRRFTSNILLLFDGDEAGQKASIRGIDLALDAGLAPRIVALPKGEDPDSFSRTHTLQELEEYFQKEAQNFVAYKVQIGKASLAQGDIGGISNLVREVIETIAKVKDSLEVNLYISQLGALVGIPEESLYERLRQVKRGKVQSALSSEYTSNTSDYNAPIKTENSNVPEKEKDLFTDAAQEEAVLKVMLRYGGLQMPDETLVAHYIYAKTIVSTWYNERYGKLLVSLYDTFSKGESPTSLQEDPMIASLFASLLTDRFTPSPSWEKLLDRELTSPDKAYVQEVISTVLYFCIFKLQGVMSQTDEELQTLDDEELITENLEMKRIMQLDQKHLAEQKGIIIIPKRGAPIPSTPIL